MRTLVIASVCAVVVSSGCGDDGGGGASDAAANAADADPNAPDADPSAPDANPNAPDADPGAPDAAPGDFQTLIARDWTVDPGTETYRCTSLTVEQDMYISTFRALDPLGTHHTVVSLTESPVRADGDYNCSAGDLEHSMLFASGVGTDDLAFPSGVAIKVLAGQQLHLNLHLFNVSEAPISGTSGTEVKVLLATQVQQEAEVVFGGTLFISLAANPAPRTISGGCDFDQDATIMAIWPHMHQIGTHLRVVHETTSNGDVTLHDGAFDFNEQLNYAIAPTLVQAGEHIEVYCTYENTTGQIVTFGDSSSNEMCFAGLYRYPATGAGLFSCAAGGGLFP